MNSTKLRSKRLILPVIAAVAALGTGGAVWASTGNSDLPGRERERIGSAATQAVGGTVLDGEESDDRGEAYEVEVRKADGTEVDVSLDNDLRVVAHSADDRDDDSDPSDRDDRALTASERSSAEKAALDAVAGGTVTKVEAGDDRGFPTRSTSAVPATRSGTSS